ncbi:MAG TPA: FAD-binding oxidoreductase [Jiangellaceae bacterium]|nr:FAD-binding oxidoreductase [Jiangellaceae bacterium]
MRTHGKVQPATVDALAEQLRGVLIRPGDDGYDQARAVHNGMVDRRPAAIAECADVADVIAAVRAARDGDALVSVRSGGHNAAGLGVCDGGLVLDLAPMRGIRVDARTSTVRVDGGCRWGDVDHATHAFGLATPSGIISTTGVAGLTLGGGIGHLSRRYGLTVDNLVSADVVLADGSFVTASSDEHPDLFWALRGGGGNFGVVTSFEFRCRPVGTVVTGPVLYDLDDAPDVLRWYREFLPSAPDDLNGFFTFMTVPPGPPFPEELHLRKVCGILWCYVGAPDRADEVLAPVRSFGRPLLDGLHEAPFPALQSAFDALYPAGTQMYWRADFFNEITDDAIAVHEKFGEVPTVQSTMHLYPIDGAVHDVDIADTAFSHRDAGWAGVIIGADADPANGPAITEWASGYWDALHPHSAGGAYVNFLMDEGDDRVRATYRGNYERLAQVKGRYDPDNFFRVNQNIAPATP